MLSRKADRPAKIDEMEKRGIGGGGPDDGQEFDARFARIDRMAGDRFAVYWMRHTGQWIPFEMGVTLVEALRSIETVELLQPT